MDYQTIHDKLKSIMNGDDEELKEVIHYVNTEVCDVSTPELIAGRLERVVPLFNDVSILYLHSELELLLRGYENELKLVEMPSDGGNTFIHRDFTGFNKSKSRFVRLFRDPKLKRTYVEFEFEDGTKDNLSVDTFNFTCYELSLLFNQIYASVCDKELNHFDTKNYQKN